MMEYDAQPILDRYYDIQKHIDQAIVRGSRTPNSVKILVVTKRQSMEKVTGIVKAGIGLLGENYPEEALKKKRVLESLGIQAEWHLIGPLQRRKVKMAVENLSMIHSVDRFSIAKEINDQAKLLGKHMPVLLQFNVSGEASKAGWNAWDENSWVEFLPEIQQICTFEFIQLKGLMTMPPLSDNPESSRRYYQKMRRLQAFLNQTFQKFTFSELSFGTSFDYEVATEEGATYVRIGTAILGEQAEK